MIIGTIDTKLKKKCIETRNKITRTKNSIAYFSLIITYKINLTYLNCISVKYNINRNNKIFPVITNAYSLSLNKMGTSDVFAKRFLYYLCTAFK